MEKETTYTIIEDVEELTLTPEQFDKVSDMLYLCDECKFYHIKDETSLSTIETKAKQS